MRLIDIYNQIARKLDYDPETDRRRKDVEELVNTIYHELFAERLWTFAQREVEITANADVTATDGITSNSPIVQTVAAFFLSWMAGQIIDIAGVEYEIAVVNSTTEAVLTETYAGTAGTGVTFTVMHRYVDLPTDCTKLLHVKDYENDLYYYEYSRYETDVLVLSPDDTGQAEAWFPAEPVAVQAPPVPPTATASGGAATVTAGSYEFAYSFKYQGRRGPLSTSVAVTVETGNQVAVTCPSTVANSGYLKTLWGRFGSWAAFRLIEDDIDEAANPATITAPVETDWLRAERAPEHDGYHERMRLYYRQSTDTVLTLRYQYRPARLIEDEDAPRLPPSYHDYLVQRVLQELYHQGDDLPSSKLAEQRADAMLARMRARFLTPETRVWVKGQVDTDRYRKFRTRYFVHA
jgi:hypothetical protein